MKYLGIDFGLRRIGLSTSEGNLASPFKTIEAVGFKDAVEKIVEIINHEKIDKVIVGLPEGKMGKTVLRFVNSLKKMGLNIQTSDETLSSKKALGQMIESDVPQKKRRFNDTVAACIILQDYLDSL